MFKKLFYICLFTLLTIFNLNAQNLKKGDYFTKVHAKYAVLKSIKENVLIFRVNDYELQKEYLKKRNNFKKLKKLNDFQAFEDSITRLHAFKHLKDITVYFINSSETKHIVSKKYDLITLTDHTGKTVNFNWKIPFVIVGFKNYLTYDTNIKSKRKYIALFNNNLKQYRNFRRYDIKLFDSVQDFSRESFKQNQRVTFKKWDSYISNLYSKYKYKAKLRNRKKLNKINKKIESLNTVRHKTLAQQMKLDKLIKKKKINMDLMDD